LKPFSVAIHCSLPAIRNGADFLTMYSSDKLSRFPSYKYEASTLALSKIWKLFAPFVQEKASCLIALGKIHDWSRTSTAPFCLPSLRVM